MIGSMLCSVGRPAVPESMVVTTAQLIVVGVAVFVAALMQIVAGFGFALLAVPLMTLAIEPKIAVVVSALTGVFVTSWQAIQAGPTPTRCWCARLTIAAYVGMPFGLLVFITVNDNILRLLLGIAVLVAVVMLALRINLHHAGPRLDYCTGFLSGVLNTSLSTNGPPLVFALQARQFPRVSFRATITAVFALSNILGLSLFIASGKITRDGLVASTITIPAMFVGQAIGYPDSQARPRRAVSLVGAGAHDRGGDQLDRPRSRLSQAPMIVALVATASWPHRRTGTRAGRPNDRLELISKPLTTVGAIAIAALAGGPASATIVGGRCARRCA